jgi:protein-disulfide isomerase
MKRILLPLLFATACTAGHDGPAAASAAPASKAAAASAAPAAAAQGDPTVAATIGDEKITLADVDKAAGRELYDLRERTLDDLVNKKVIEAAAKKAGQSVDEYLQKQMEQRVPQISEQEAQDWFNQNQARLSQQFAGKTFADVKDQIVKGLTDAKRREAAGAFIQELRQQAGVKVLMEPPRVTVAATGPARGPDNAPITIVEFSDFQCPFCSRGRETMEQVMKAYDGKVKFVFRDFPLSFHEHAQKAAEAGHCADEQGKFWQMHDWMFTHQGNLEVADLGNAAKDLGMDKAKFDECVSSGKFAKAVAENQQAGSEAGVSGTPAFFVNGVMINGAQPFDKFKEIIDAELAKKGG